MKTKAVYVLLSLLVLTLTGSAESQSLEKRHQLELRVGMFNQVADTRTEIGIGSVSTSVGASGFAGSLSYGHWLQENLALNVSVGSMVADVTTETDIFGTSSVTAVVAPIMISMKYYFPNSSLTSATRPFLKGGVGTFIGSQTKTESGFLTLVESRTEAAFGGELGAGVDFLVSRKVMIGLTTGYVFMTDFDRPIGGSNNYSGPTFSIGFSFLFGKGTK